MAGNLKLKFSYSQFTELYHYLKKGGYGSFRHYSQHVILSVLIFLSKTPLTTRILYEEL